MSLYEDEAFRHMQCDATRVITNHQTAASHLCITGKTHETDREIATTHECITEGSITEQSLSQGFIAQ